MTASEKQARAEKIFDQLWKAFDFRDIDYIRGLEPLCFTSYQITRKNLDLAFTLDVDVDNMAVRIYSDLDIEVPEAMRSDMAVCVSRANGKLKEGFFRYDIEDGLITFYLIRYYGMFNVSDSYLTEMYYRAGMMIDEFFCEFYNLATGYMKLEAVINEIAFKKLIKWTASEDYIENADAVFDMLAVGAKNRNLNVRVFKKTNMFYINVPYVDDHSIDLIVNFDVEDQFLTIDVPFGINVKPEKAFDVAAVACDITGRIDSGAMCFDYPAGSIYYSITTSFLDAGISEAVFAEMVRKAVTVYTKFFPIMKIIGNGGII